MSRPGKHEPISADGVRLYLGQTVWLVWGGVDPRTGQLRSVRGEITKLTRGGRITIVRPDGGRPAHGSVSGAYVRAKPLIRPGLSTLDQLRNQLNRVQVCDRCDGICHPEDCWTDGAEGRPEAYTYLYCAHCGAGTKVVWRYVDGWWKEVYVARVTREDQPERHAQFLRDLDAARTKDTAVA